MCEVLRSLTAPVLQVQEGCREGSATEQSSAVAACGPLQAKVLRLRRALRGHGCMAYGSIFSMVGLSPPVGAKPLVNQQFVSSRRYPLTQGKGFAFHKDEVSESPARRTRVNQTTLARRYGRDGHPRAVSDFLCSTNGHIEKNMQGKPLSPKSFSSKAGQASHSFQNSGPR